MISVPVAHDKQEQSCASAPKVRHQASNHSQVWKTVLVSLRGDQRVPLLRAERNLAGRSID